MNSILCAFAVISLGQDLQRETDNIMRMAPENWNEKEEDWKSYARDLIYMNLRAEREAKQYGITKEMAKLRWREYRLTTKTTVTKKITDDTVVVRTGSLIMVQKKKETTTGNIVRVNGRDQLNRIPAPVVPLKDLWETPTGVKANATEEIVLRNLPKGSTDGHIFTRIKNFKFTFDGWVEIDGEKLRVLRYAGVAANGGEG